MALGKDYLLCKLLVLSGLESWLGLGVPGLVPRPRIVSRECRAWSHIVCAAGLEKAGPEQSLEMCTWGWLSKVAEVGVGPGWEGVLGECWATGQVGGVTGASMGQAKGSWGTQTVALDSISLPPERATAVPYLFVELQN